MKIFKTILSLRQWIAGEHRNRRTIGLVPTMGALHAGHLSLVRISRSRADRTVMSIFVNPTQFGPNEDFAKYPRSLGQDLARAEKAGTDAVFAPSVKEMYGEGGLVRVQVDGITRHFCGASRPGHFAGVATVVLKLFNIVQPDAAIFGQKDAQQCAVIRQIIRDLNLPVKLVIAPIVREPDGLAMSSRNRYLSAAAREKAIVFSQSLKLAKKLYQAGERESAKIKLAVRDFWKTVPAFRPEYFDLAESNIFQPVSRVRGDVLALIAGRIEGARLIDNMVMCGKFRAE